MEKSFRNILAKPIPIILDSEKNFEWNAIENSEHIERIIHEILNDKYLG